jgi:hypothetical protein
VSLALPEARQGLSGSMGGAGRAHPIYLGPNQPRALRRRQRRGTTSRPPPPRSPSVLWREALSSVNPTPQWWPGERLRFLSSRGIRESRDFTVPFLVSRCDCGKPDEKGMEEGITSPSADGLIFVLPPSYEECNPSI